MTQGKEVRGKKHFYYMKLGGEKCLCQNRTKPKCDTGSRTYSKICTRLEDMQYKRKIILTNHHSNM